MKELVYIQEAGCNRRQLDLERIRTYLEINGYVLVSTAEEADRILVATCAFKKKEEDDSVDRLEALRKYADKVVVFGCLPDIAPERFARFDNMPKVAPRELDRIEEHFKADLQSFVDVTDAHLLPRGRSLPGWNILRRNLVSALKHGGGINGDLLHQFLVTSKQRLRSVLDKRESCYYLLICRGCAGKCSYCAIRRSIGTVKSKPVGAVVDDFVNGVAKGFTNFVILGDDPGCYGLETGSSLPELLDALGSRSRQFAAQENIYTGFHLKEVHPKFLIASTSALLDGSAMPQVRSLLCPIQSGSNKILASMEREHDIESLADSLVRIKGQFPEVTLTTQMIVGFPGETDDDFRQTLEAVKNIGFASVVVFPYDNKEGTVAAALPHKVPQNIIGKRMRQAFSFFKTSGIPAFYNCPP